MPQYTQQLVPMLNTNDLQETMRFYVEKLGFRVTGTWPEGDHATWCSLAAGSAVIMFSGPGPGHTHVHETVCTGQIYLYPKNIEDAWVELKDSVEVVSELLEHPWGMRDFRIHDPNGYELIFGQSAEHEH